MEGPDKAVYTGNSMRGVFVPGEMLVLAETAFGTLQIDLSSIKSRVSAGFF